MQMANLQKRLRSTGGETLVETLVSLLIGGLSLLMLAVVIASVSHITAESKNALDDYYSDAYDIALATTQVSGTVTLKEGASDVQLSAKSGTGSASVSYSDGEVAGYPVVSYQMAGEGGSGSGSGGSGGE